MPYTRDQVIAAHKHDFDIYDKFPLGEGQMYSTLTFTIFSESLNATIDASEQQLARTMYELRWRCAEKVEALAGAPKPSQRPRIQYIDLAAYLNSCKSST